MPHKFGFTPSIGLSSPLFLEENRAMVFFLYSFADSLISPLLFMSDFHILISQINISVSAVIVLKHCQELSEQRHSPSETTLIPGLILTFTAVFPKLTRIEKAVNRHMGHIDNFRIISQATLRCVCIHNSLPITLHNVCLPDARNVYLHLTPDPLPNVRM